MASPRAEVFSGKDDKPAREPEAASTPGAGKGKALAGWQAWLPLGLALVLMPVLAYAMTSLVLVPRLQKALRGPSAPAPAPAAEHASGEAAVAETKTGGTSSPRQNVTLNKVLVNVAGTMGSRYLLVSMTLVGTSPDFPAKVAEKEPQLKDIAGGLLSTKTIADLEKPSARNMIRGELLAGFNSVLGNSAIQEIYFTEFAIQ